MAGSLANELDTINFVSHGVVRNGADLGEVLVCGVVMVESIPQRVLTGRKRERTGACVSNSAKKKEENVMKKNLKACLMRFAAPVLVGGSLLLSAGVASATAIVDYTAAATTATTELTAAVASGLPLFGTIVAIGVGMRIVKKFWHG